MPVIENTTPNRSYHEPHGSNPLKTDVLRMIDALRAIDQDIADMIAQIVLRAPLVSPALSGAPTSPTPADNDNSTKIATTAWVRGYLDDLAGAAPETLDTIAEIAAALHNNPDVITELLTSVGGKLGKDQNLDDLPDKAAARANLDVEQAAGSVPTKAAPVDADVFGYNDSAASFARKKLTWGNIKVRLKAYFDTIYALATHSHAFADITTKPTTVAGYGITDVVFTKSYTSGQLTISNAGAHTLTHGLGTVPKLVVVEAICLTAELGWSVGDVAYAGSFYVNGVGLTFLLSRTATDIGVKFVNGSAPLYLLHKSTGSGRFATSANWRLIVSAYA